MAPAFGADDYAAGQRHGLAFLQPVDGRGRFPADMPLVGGMFVKDADPIIIDELKRRGVLWKTQKFEHSVSALLALRDAAAVLRALVVVRAHDRLQGRHAVAQRARELASAGSRERAVRRVAHEQHRLGDLARSLLGHAAPDLGQRRRIRTSSSRSAATPSSPSESASRFAADFDPHKPFIDHYTWPAHVGATARCVAFPKSSIRGSIPARCRSRSGTIRSRTARCFERHLSGGLHRRRRRSDARLVLLAARDRDRSRRRAAAQHARDGGVGRPYQRLSS